MSHPCFLRTRIIKALQGRILLYNIILVGLGILTLPWVIYQLCFVKKRRQGLAQRLGFLPASENKTVWCHAVSVGEVKAMGPVLSLLQEDERIGGRIVLSTVTLTGQETARRECGFVSSIVYFPLDFLFPVARALRRINPQVFITAETEIWPNFFNACFKRDIPVIVVNGRISDSSFSRYRKLRWFFRPVLRDVSAFLMQSEEDARRILELGARPGTVKVTGNMKYDRIPDPVPLPDAVMKWKKGRFLLVAGSTHAGEEEIILESLQRLRDHEILLALVPRHPERFDEVAGLLTKRGVLYTRYTGIVEKGSVEENVLLVDAMGVLDGFYSLADIAFVGGSFVPVGGHNLLEPAMHGIPVLTGPHLHNFRDIAEDLVSSGACLIVNDRDAFTSAVNMLLTDQTRRAAMEKAALTCSGAVSGASEKNLEAILAIMPP